VDWSPDLNSDTSEARHATTLEFYKAFVDGAWLLRELNDATSAENFERSVGSLKHGIDDLVDKTNGTLGARWQTNAMAIFAGATNPDQTAAIWDRVLSHPSQFTISPYYNFYVITAMAEAGHRKEALDWIRQYWGGMIEEGATSFWEAYDPSWPKENFHASLQADNGQGYFVSLSHGWSSGPTAWLIEQILGIQPQSRGFAQVTIRPDLAGLQWVRGQEPTPRGVIKIDLKSTGQASASSGLDAAIDLPSDTEATVSMPVSQRNSTAVLVNGRSLGGNPSEGGTRSLVRLTQPGHYELRSQ
jgi:hypothetical protein